MRKPAMFAIASVLLAGCTTTDRYRGLDAAPGGTVSGTSSFQRAMSGLNPVQSNYASRWTRMRVIAPAGATRCRIAGQSPFVPKGPESEGRPNAQREVMLTYDARAKRAAFECKTPAGVVRRSVNAVPYDYTPKRPAGPIPLKLISQVMPPLVHVDPSDPEAEARWTAIGAELCPVVSDRAVSFICKPGMLGKLKAEDIGAARGAGGGAGAAGETA